MNFEIDDVVNRRWMIRESLLDNEQYAIRMLKKGNYLIGGVAGSGKTVLALQKAKELEESGVGDYLIVLYTRALKTFVKDGLIQLGISEDKVWYYHELKDSGYSNIDYLIIDEIQDFSKEQIERLLKFTNKNFIFFGDDAQQVYSKGSNLEDIMRYTNLHKINYKELKKNYRVPRSIAEFSSHIKQDYGLPDKCDKDGGELPRIFKCDNFFQEICCIKRIIEEEVWTDVGILFANNEQIIEAEQIFKELGMDVERKVKIQQQNHENLNFYTSKPKLLTYHSSKGLQFEHVFMPSCEVSTNSLNYKQAIYVACTRASETLDLFYSGALSQFIVRIPKELYIHQEYKGGEFLK